MATAQDIFNAAMRTLNVLATGETPTALESADGLATLNRMLSSWNAEGIMIPYISTDAYVLTGANTVTIGTGGQINTSRPVAIRTMHIDANSGRQELVPMTVEGYGAIRDWSRTGKFAKRFFFSPLSSVLAQIYLWPTPASGGTLTVHSLKPMAQFGSLAGVVAMPEGYERALVALLALELAPEFGAQATEVLIANAQSAKAAIVGLNAAVLGTPPSQAQKEAQPAA